MDTSLLLRCFMFHEHLSAKLRSMGFKPTLMDQDLWTRRKHGKYEYIICGRFLSL
jgi:hypothetical protein